MSTALDWLRPRRPEPVTQLTTEWARYDGLAGRTPGDVLVPADIIAGREGRAAALAGPAVAHDRDQSLGPSSAFCPFRAG